MKIVIAGGTGFIGTPLVRALLPRGEVVVLTRDAGHVKSGRGVVWNPPQSGEWTREIADANVIINLAGENVGEGRWTEERKKKLVQSRLDSTAALVDAMKSSPGRSGQRTFINASAIGYYGDRADEILDESATSGPGFLADLSVRWEAAARGAETLARLVILRLGVVLDPSGGALKKMLVPFRLGAGGPVGTGQQWMSWIDRGDLIRMIEWAIDRREARGVYDATAPQPVRNREFTAALGRVLHRPAFMPAPAFALRLAFGQMADEVLLAGQRVLPRRALEEGFRFEYETIDASLKRMF